MTVAEQLGADARPINRLRCVGSKQEIGCVLHLPLFPSSALCRLVPEGRFCKPANRIERHGTLVDSSQDFQNLFTKAGVLVEKRLRSSTGIFQWRCPRHAPTISHWLTPAVPTRHSEHHSTRLRIVGLDPSRPPIRTAISDNAMSQFGRLRPGIGSASALPVSITSRGRSNSSSRHCQGIAQHMRRTRAGFLSTPRQLGTRRRNDQGYPVDSACHVSGDKSSLRPRSLATIRHSRMAFSTARTRHSRSPPAILWVGIVSWQHGQQASSKSPLAPSHQTSLPPHGLDRERLLGGLFC